MTGPEREPWEDRLRDALHSPGSERIDIDGFIGQVHRGARGKRRRQVLGSVAAVAVLVGGGYAVTVADPFGNANEPIAAATTGPDSVATSSTAATEKTTATEPTPTKGTVTFTSENTDVLSLTATGNDHQWVLTRTRDAACPANSCATVFTRSADDVGWTSLGSLDVPANPGARYQGVVENLRVSGDAKSGYNAYAFTSGLFSAHGLTSAADATGESFNAVKTPVSGQVTAVESRADTTYALVADGETASDLIMSPASRDDFKVVDIGMDLYDTFDLSVSQGAIAFISTGGSGGRVVSNVTDDGAVATGDWQVTEPCGGLEVEHLSSAANVLWALCSNGSVLTTMVTDTVPVWSEVADAGTFGRGALLTARSTTSAVVAEATGLSELGSDGDVSQLTGDDFSGADLIGFTNESLGFAVVDDHLLETTDGGGTWSEEPIL